MVPAMRPFLAAVCLLTLLSGCLGAAHAPAPTHTLRTAEESRLKHPPGTPGNVTLTRHFSGTIVYRVPGDRQFQGDPSAFCFEVPDDTTRLAGHLTWDAPQQMGLEFHGPDTYVSTFDEPSGLVATQGPLDLVVAGPAAATWFTYAGPGIAGGQVHWDLTLSWDVARGNASIDEVAKTKEC